MNVFTSDEAYVEYLNRLRLVLALAPSIADEQVTNFLANGLELFQDQITPVLTALRDSCIDVDATMKTKHELTGKFSKAEEEGMPTSGNYSTSAVDFRFSPDFTYEYEFLYYRGYVSSPISPVYVSSASQPVHTQKSGIYFVGKFDANTNETAIVVCLTDGSTENLSFRISGNRYYISGREMKKSY